MALALGMYKGQVVQIGKNYLKVVDVHGPRSCDVALCDKFGKVISGTGKTLTDHKASEVMDNVFLSSGVGTHGMARVVIDAPKSVSITRLGNVGDSRSIN